MGCRRLQGSKLTGKKDAGCSELDGPFGDIEKAIGIHPPGFDLRGNPLLRCAITGKITLNSSLQRRSKCLDVPPDHCWVDVRVRDSGCWRLGRSGTQT